MYSTTVYLYQQIVRVLLVDTSGGYFTKRYDPVYAKQLTINKGVDNVLLFEFINQDQKPVNIAGSDFVFRVVNQAGDELLLTKSMEILSSALGRVKVVLNSADTINIQAQPASYSIQRTAGNYIQAAYVDANSQARADCNIVDSILPQFQPSQPVTVPDLYGKNQYVGTAPTGYPDWALNPQPINSVQMTEFYSSYIDTTGASFTTVKFDLVHYTGTIKVQAAENYEAVWTDVSESRQYLDQTVSDYFNVVGFHPLLRLALNNSVGYGATGNVQVTNGVVTGISLTNLGQYYVAAPYVQILGDGAGATALANVGATGVVSSVTVTNGGAGYLPMQFANGGTAATVIFSNGLIQNVQYR
jgi:hypothetical protein